MRFKSLPVFLLHYLIILILLLAFGEYAFATKPRKAGIGLKYGYTQDDTRFEGTRDDENTNTYIAADGWGESINNPGTTHIPIFVQFDENLMNEFSFSYWFFDLTRLIQTGHHLNYLELVIVI